MDAPGGGTRVGYVLSAQGPPERREDSVGPAAGGFDGEGFDKCVAGVTFGAHTLRFQPGLDCRVDCAFGGTVTAVPEDGSGAVLGDRGAQRFLSRTPAAFERNAERSQIARQGLQGLVLPPAGSGSSRSKRRVAFGDEKGSDRSTGFERGREGRVVAHPQIISKPDQRICCHRKFFCRQAVRCRPNAGIAVLAERASPILPGNEKCGPIGSLSGAFAALPVRFRRRISAPDFQ